MHRILGERVELRELPPEQAVRLLAGARESHWSPEYPFDGSRVAAGLLVRASRSGELQPGFGMYQILRRSDGLVVGDVGFHAAPDADGRVEIGYELVPSARGSGLMSDAIRALTGWALAQPGVRTIEANTTADNSGSQGVLSRTGFTVASRQQDDIYYRLEADGRDAQ